jgi:DtxR family Mn-dependent transcriptional regulator
MAAHLDPEHVGKSREDYLEAILIIKERQGYVRSTDVADQLGVTKPSVSYATRHLKEEGYITADHAGMLVLTDEGMEIAKRIYHRHRTLTKMFIELGVDSEQAQIDACKIEHDISEETFEAICNHFNVPIEYQG